MRVGARIRVICRAARLRRAVLHWGEECAIARGSAAVRGSAVGGKLMECDLERVREFHGHLGPYVVIGWRMGRRAMADLGIPKHFGVSCHVVCADEPPESCLIDGLQLATGCTMGKRNITHEVGGPIEVRITAKETGRTVTVRPCQGGVARAVALMREQGEEAAVRWLESAGDDEIMTIE